MPQAQRFACMCRVASNIFCTGERSWRPIVAISGGNSVFQSVVRIEMV